MQWVLRKCWSKCIDEAVFSKCKVARFVLTIYQTLLVLIKWINEFILQNFLAHEVARTNTYHNLTLKPNAKGVHRGEYLCPNISHYYDATCKSCRLTSSANRLFIQLLFRLMIIKYNSSVLLALDVSGWNTLVTGGFHRQLCGKRFHGKRSSC